MGFQQVFTDGFHHKYSPIYYGNDGWKININDSVSFISTATLEKLYGKECIIREVDFLKDTFLVDNNYTNNSFDYIFVNSEDNKPMVLTGYVNSNIIMHYGRLTRFNFNDYKILKFS